MSLDTTRKIQNRIFARDVYESDIEQNYFIFLGNHPTLFQEFIDTGFLTITEMNYINEHFHDYNVDPRTFENEFKRAMRESLPRYNNLKSIELIDEVFDLTDDNYTREIVSQRATHLAQNGTNTSNQTGSETQSNNGTNNTTGTNKQANKNLPMQSLGNGFDNIVSWNNGASAIGENHNTVNNTTSNSLTGSSTINKQDANALLSDGTDNGNTKETYNRHGNPVDHIDKIWQYLLKPKAIEYLTSALSVAFILVY